MNEELNGYENPMDHALERGILRMIRYALAAILFLVSLIIAYFFV